MTGIPLLASTAANAEASQQIGVINGVIQSINANALIGSTAPTSLRNIIIGGDFNTNLWQRGTSFAAIANVATYTADRFFAVGGASSSIAVSKQTTSLPVGFGAKLRFLRTASNANTAAITLNYIVASEDVLQMQGQPFVLSFYAQANANYSAAANALAVSVSTGTVADEGNSAYTAGTWTGVAAVTLTGSTGATATGVTLTGAWQRYALAGVVPAAALELGITWSVTPVGTAGAADSFEIAGVQLEVMPQGGVNPTPFERRPVQLERQLQQRYTQVFQEPTTGNLMSIGIAISTSTARVPLPIAVPFRVAPSATFNASSGGWVLEAASGTLSATANCTALTTPSALQTTMLVTTGATLTVSAPVALTGTGVTTNPITLSAEL